MKRSTERLIDDLLDESLTPEFRAGLLTDTLRQVRRRKRLRQLRTGLIVSLTVALCAIVLRPARERSAERQVADKPPASLAPSQPLEKSTTPGIVPGSVTIVSSSASTVTVIESRTAASTYTEINDEQLFALLGNKPAALVHHAGASAELILLEANDEERLLFP